MTSLIISFLPLIAAPWLCRICARSTALAHFMDGFVFVAIGGLLVSGVLPQAWLNGGWLVVVFLLLGLLLPVASERILRHVGDVHRVALLLGLSGLLLHAITDGAALSQAVTTSGHGEHSDGNLLSMSVLLHRLPIGLTIWWLVYPQFGLWAASSVLSVIGLGTVLGFAFAPGIMEPLSTQGMAFFQAFVSGSLVHVLYHRPHASAEQHGEHRHHHAEPSVLPDRWAEGAGNICGGALVLLLASQHEHSAEWGWLATMEHTLLALALASAPLLLAAYALSASLNVCSARYGYTSAGRHARPRLRLTGIIASSSYRTEHPADFTRAAALTAPGERAVWLLTLVGAGLLAIDAMLLSVGLLGMALTMWRIATVCILLLLLRASLAYLVTRAQGIGDVPSDALPEAECAGFNAWWRDFWARVEQGAPWMLLGLCCAAVAQPMLDSGLIDAWLGPADVLLLALLGLIFPLRVMALTPLLALLLAAGISPGAVLAVLITGPLIYPQLLRVIVRWSGYGYAAGYVLLIALFAVCAGLALNICWQPAQPWTVPDAGHSTLAYLCLLLCLLMYVFIILRRGVRALVMQLLTPGGGCDHHH